MVDKDYLIRTGKWGPYNKDYLGIVNIADEKQGATFNFELFPGIYHRTVLCDRVIIDSGVRMFGANGDLTNFTYRYEIEWKDKIYCDTTYHINNDKEVLVECKFVNNTDLVQSLCLNAVFSLNYPTKKWWSYVDGFNKVSSYKVDNKAKYIDAVEYEDIKCASKIAVHGNILGEDAYDYATNMGRAIHERYFGKSDKHFLAYKFDKISCDGIGVRYTAQQDTALTFIVNGKIIKLNLEKSKKFSFKYLNFDEVELESFKVYANGEPITIDCFVVGKNVEKSKFSKKKFNVNPEIETDFVYTKGAFGATGVGCEEDLKEKNNKIFIKYPDIDTAYSIEWDKPHNTIPSYETNDIYILLKQCIHNEVYDIEESKPTERKYKDIIFGPLFMQPHSEQTINFILRSGDLETLKKTSAQVTKKQRFEVACNSDGEKYRFSQNIMSYTTLLNLIYPVYSRRGYRKAYTPGRLYDSLYTWDNGFIGMGLATMSFDRAYDCLNFYLTPENDKHSPFIFTGTILPMQVLLYSYLFNNFDKYDELKKLYPCMRGYYRFFGNLKDDENQMKSGLLKLWHINYNSGGWDDYPPQRALTGMAQAKEKLLDGASVKNTTPVVTTAITVLISKIMKQMALKLGYLEDVKEYERNIEFYSNAIQKYAYDEESGYYQYVVHDDDGNAKCFFKNSDGTLFNSGFDGIYPYISGITNEKQAEKIIKNIKENMFTPYGLSTVDPRATYYSKTGYWNGNIWFPHQWILWNTLLDNGECDLATKISKIALEVWDKEVNQTYNCYENFSCTTGRGNGYHMFGGLSTPILMWFKSYYTPNTISVGFLTYITNKKFTDDCSSTSFDYTTEGANPHCLVCLNEKYDYKFEVNGKQVNAEKCTNGAYYLKLSGTQGSVNITKI